MLDWKLFALITPLFFIIYQTISKFLPKDTSVFLVNAYASLIGFIIMIIFQLLFSPNKSLTINVKVLPLVIAIGILISFGNFGIIKAYSLGAPQSLFSLIFYVVLIIYGILFGLLLWHEKLNPMQIMGVLLSISGLLFIIYFKK